MKKQAIYPFVSLSVLLAALNLQAQTLPEAVKLALAYHPQLVISEQSIAAQQAHVVEAEAALKPHVMLSGELGRSTLETSALFPESGGRWPNTLSVVLSQPLYRGGALTAATDKAKLSVTASEYQRQQLRVNIAIQAVAAYAAVVRDQSLLALYQQSLTTLKQAKQDADKRFNAGEATKTDTAQAAARLAEGEAQLTQAQANIAISQAQFVRVIGTSAQQLNAHLPVLAVPTDLNAAIEKALNSPAILAQQQQALATEKDITIAQADNKLQVTAEARATTQDNTDFGYDRMNGWGVYLKAQLPLYQGGRSAAKVNAAIANTAAAQQHSTDIIADVKQQMTAAWQHWQAANARVPAYQAQVQAATLALESTQKELRVGTRTTLDLLNAERELLSANINAVLSEQDKSLASYQILAVIGDLSVLTQE